MRIKIQASDDPFQRISTQIGKMMREMVNQNFFRSYRPHHWKPAINVYDLPDSWVVCVDIAGVSPVDFDLSTYEGALHLRGRRPRPALDAPSESVSVEVMEIDWGPFYRRIPLPNNVDADAVEAHYRNGYLWICFKLRARQDEGEHS